MYAVLPQRIDDQLIDQLLGLVKQLDIAPGPGGSRISDFDATQALLRPYVQLAPFDGTWTRAMVVALYPSAQLVGHKDPPITGTRYHIPLQTNEGCWVHHGGEWLQLHVGCIYAMDPTTFHGAVNWGHTLRLHLAIDVL